MATTALRDRVHEADAKAIQRQAAPVLMALQASAREVSAGARALESAVHAARRPTLLQAVTLVAAGMLLCALTFLAMPRGPCAPATAKERQLYLGTRLEAIGPAAQGADRILPHARQATP